MRIAFLGSRGIPACYSGFETFYEQLAVRLAARGHSVTVYNRSHFLRHSGKEYKGVRLVTLPSIPTKHMDTITHTALSTLHLMFQPCDIAYYCIVGNAPLVWLPRLRGIPTVLNVDAADWAREKWGRFASWYQKSCERIATRSASLLIADSRVIKKRYLSLFGQNAVYAPYGANTLVAAGTRALDRFHLEPRKYLLFVGRLVPENGVHFLIDAYRGVRTAMPLVIVGDAPHAETYKRGLRQAADPRVIFTGYVFGKEYEELSSHAYAAVQPSAIEGTRPALLDQLGFGNCVIARGSMANREVLTDAGIICAADNPVESLRAAIDMAVSDGDFVAAVRARAQGRITHFYNWNWIADFYEDLFRRLLARKAPDDYDVFIGKAKTDDR